MQPRWARANESQAPHKVKQGRSFGEKEARRATPELFGARSVAEQNRNAPAVIRAFHVDPGVADKPYRVARLDAARLEGERDRGGGRLVQRRIPRPNDTAEQLGPPDPLSLAPQERAGLVADHTEENAFGGQLAEQLAAAR